jgi:hypothetical protein
VHLGEITTPHVPRKGDLLDYHPPEWTGFNGQSTWRVEEIIWQVAMPGSAWVLDRLRSGGITDPSGSGHVTDDVHVIVWPEPGPFWPKIPGWAKPFHREDDGD